MTRSIIPPISVQFQAGLDPSAISTLQGTNTSLVLGFLEAAQETASIADALEYLERLEPALDAIGASRMATRAGRLIRAKEGRDQVEWLNATHDYFGSIIDAKEKETTLVEVLAESREAMDLLLGTSPAVSELHEDYARRARQLRRLLDENRLPKVQAMDARYKNAVLFILATEPHITEMLALDGTLNYLSAGVWAISAAVYGQMEAANLVYERLEIANCLLGKLGIEPDFEVKIGKAFEQADRLQERIQEIDIETRIPIPLSETESEPDRLSLPPEGDSIDASEDTETLFSNSADPETTRDRSRVTLGELFPGTLGAPLARIRLQSEQAPKTEESGLAAQTVQSLIDSLDVLLESLRG